MENFFDWNGDGRVVFWIYLHNISHHVPPFLGYWVNTIGSVLGVAFALTLLIAKQDVCVLIPINGIVADAAVFYHLHQFWPDGSMAFLIFLFATRLEEHFKCESHIFMLLQMGLLFLVELGHSYLLLYRGVSGQIPFRSALRCLAKPA